MKRIWFCALIAAMAVAGVGCKDSTATQGAPPPTGQPGIPTQAQPKLQTLKLWVGPQELITELAVTPIQEQTGMMFRTNMAENEAMLFPFAQPLRASFWMKNTFLPLSCAYIGADGTILELHDMQPHDTNSIVASTDNIQYVLETKQGWFKRNNIGVGTVISSERGPLHKVFFGN